MTDAIRQAYYLLGFVATLWLAFGWVAARMKGSFASRSAQFGVGAGAIVVAILPLAGLPIWRWGLSIWPSPSVTFIGLVCLALAQRLSGRNFFGRADWQAAWIFGLVAGSALGLQSLSPVAMDLYRWGWDGAVAVGGLAVLAMGYLALGNRFGVLLLAAIVAWIAGVLESTNLWDYVMNPIYWLVSLGGCLTLWRNGRAASQRPVAPPVMAPPTVAHRDPV